MFDLMSVSYCVCALLDQLICWSPLVLHVSVLGSTDLLFCWMLLLVFVFVLLLLKWGLGLGSERECIDRNACRWAAQPARSPPSTISISQI
jgi:hypothetical protein